MWSSTIRRPYSITILTLVFWLTSLQEVRGQAKTCINRTCSEDADCPVWTKCNNSQCVCGAGLNKNNIVICNQETLQLSVSSCHCVTFDPKTKELFEGDCMENCQNPDKKVLEHIPLPINVSKLNHFMCEKRFKRTGRLCGKCLPGHSPLAYSYDLRCVKCPEGNKNVWKYVLIAFGPLTIFYFVVLFLKINVTSSYLQGCVTFSQVFLTPSAVRNAVIVYNLKHPHTASPYCFCRKHVHDVES